MSPEQVTALVVAFTGLLAAIGVCIGQIAALRRDVNGRLTQLLQEVAAAERREGELAGRDFVHRQLGRLADTPISKDVP